MRSSRSSTRLPSSEPPCRVPAPGGTKPSPIAVLSSQLSGRLIRSCVFLTPLEDAHDSPGGSSTKQSSSADRAITITEFPLPRWSAVSVLSDQDDGGTDQQCQEDDDPDCFEEVPDPCGSRRQRFRGAFPDPGGGRRSAKGQRFHYGILPYPALLVVTRVKPMPCPYSRPRDRGGILSLLAEQHEDEVPNGKDCAVFPAVERLSSPSSVVRDRFHAV